MRVHVARLFPSADRSSPSKVPLRPTAWVDGLKGFAMLGVFNYHYFFAWSEAPDKGWDHGGGYALLTVHLFRFFVNGLAMVYLFFMLGGYVVSLAPLRLMAEGAPGDGKLMMQLSSSIFRRSLRLLLPVIAIDAIIFLLIRIGLYQWALPHFNTLPGFRPEPHFSIIPPFWEHLRIWTKEVGILMNVFEFGTARPGQHDPHQWFIPVQLRASLACYLALAMVACTRHRARKPLLFGLSIYSMRYSRYEVALFLWGACLANPPLISKADVLPMRHYRLEQNAEQTCEEETNADADRVPLMLQGSASRLSLDMEEVDVSEEKRKAHGDSFLAHTYQIGGSVVALVTRTIRLPFLSTAIWTAELGLAIWFLSWPRYDYDRSVGFRTLAAWIPDWYESKLTFWPAIGTGLFVHCVARSSVTSAPSKLLRSRLAQLLGRYSFAFYLCHGPFLYTLGFPFLAFVQRTIDTQNQLGPWMLGMMIAYLFSFVSISLLAFLFFKFVEQPCGKLSQSIERLVFRPQSTS